MKVSAEEIYEELYRQKFYKNKGFYPKRIKNFDSLKQKYPEAWKSLEVFTDIVNRNAGNIDYSIYIESLVNEYGQNVKLKDLPERKSIKIYRNYIKDRDLNIKEDGTYKRFIQSVNFVVDYCRKNNLTFRGYVENNIATVPDVVKHYNAGSICTYFLAMIPDLDIVFNSFPQDVVRDFIDAEKFDSDFAKVKQRIRNNSQFNKWRENFYDKMDKLIRKKKEKS